MLEGGLPGSAWTGRRRRAATAAEARFLLEVANLQYVYVGPTEVKALIVGLVTGVLYGALNLPIPAPGVLGGNLAILFTFIGLVIVGVIRHEMVIGRPPRSSSMEAQK